jgi:hypothetical protein
MSRHIYNMGHHHPRLIMRQAMSSFDGSNSTEAPIGDGAAAVPAADEEVILPSDTEMTVDPSSIQGLADANGSAKKEEAYPSGDLVYKRKGGWESFVVKCRMLIAWPWQRVKNGSVLKLKLTGQVMQKNQTGSPFFCMLIFICTQRRKF